MMRFGIITLASIAPFLFPYPFTLVLSFLAGLFFPPLPLLIGVVVDVLYYHPTLAVLPYGVIGGVVASIGAFFARGFLRSRVAL